MNITPQYAAAEKGSQTIHVQVPPVINMPATEAAKTLKQAGLTVRLEETGERVADQLPKPGSRVPKGTNVLLYTNSPRYFAGQVTVPDCSGQTLSQSAAIMTEVGLLIQPIRNGTTIIKQDPLPGSKVLPNTVIQLFME